MEGDPLFCLFGCCAKAGVAIDAVTISDTAIIRAKSRLPLIFICFKRSNNLSVMSLRCPQSHTNTLGEPLNDLHTEFWFFAYYLSKFCFCKN